jgi:hypothetical protein
LQKPVSRYAKSSDRIEDEIGVVLESKTKRNGGEEDTTMSRPQGKGPIGLSSPTPLKNQVWKTAEYLYRDR